MGLFSRKEPSSNTGRRNATRGNSEAQAAELRVRARRRLIGALVLVLAAVIFVPMLFDSPPEEELTSPVVLPEPIPPIPSEPQVALGPESIPPSSGGSIETPVEVVPDDEPPVEQSATTSPATDDLAGQEQTPSKSEEAAQSAAAANQSSRPENKPSTSKSGFQPSNDRTDDGSVALALLEGRQPPTSSGSTAASRSGNFVLQVAAYTTDKDAQLRREKLVAAGVTNAYVEQAVANGKTAFRLRVGPFPTREAAEAAQARLRQLGYNNGLIFNK